MINSMLGAGYLIPRLPGVYAVGHAAPTELARETEALLCLLLAHLSQPPLGGRALGAATEIAEPDAPVDILIHGDTTVRHPGIRSHRTKHLDRKDVRIHAGLPVTSPARTFLDVAPLVSLDELERMLDDALERKLVRISEVREVLARCGAGRPGAHRLQQLLDERTGRSNALSRSYWERRLRDTLKLADIPPTR